MAKRKECKKGGKIQVVVEEFGSIIDDVFVYCSPKEAEDHVNKFIKKHFGSKKKFKEAHGQTDKSDIYHFETKMK